MKLKPNTFDFIFFLLGVLRDVCDKTLSDPTVPKTTLIKRASALKMIGAVFEAVKADKPAEP